MILRSRTGAFHFVGLGRCSWNLQRIPDLHVGEDGVPASDGTLFRLGPVSRENPIVLVSTRDLEVTVVEKNAEKPETIPSGSSFTITGTDGMSFVEAELDDGRTCRIPVPKRGWANGSGRLTVSVSTTVLNRFLMPDRGGKAHRNKKERKDREYDEITRRFSYTHNLL